MKRILVSDIMTREPISVSRDTTLFECAHRMVRKNVGSILITDNKRLIGFISQRDILWALIKKPNIDLSSIRAIEISPKKLATIKPSSLVEEAMNKMKKFRFERLPVIHEGVLVGVITIKDILNFHPELYPELDELSQIRDEAKKLIRVKKARQEKNSIHEGICEECGGQDFLQRINGLLICESCKNSM